MRVEFVDLRAQYRALKAQIDARIARVLEHGRFVNGPEVGEMEERLAQFAGVRHCVAVASGTDALLVALLALGVGRDDEVVTSAFGFAAAVEVTFLLGATPVLCDVEEETGNLDAARLAAVLGARTRAIVPVGLYGQPCDMDEICALAARRGIAVVEDAAQSFGARYRGRRSGALGTVAVASFFPAKPLGCYGDGGALFTDDEALARACREIRDHGQRGRYRHERLGLNARMDSIQCAVVLAKLPAFEDELERRAALARRYDAALPAALRRMVVKPDRTSAWAQYTVRSGARERLTAHLAERGIPTAVHYPRALHEQPAWAARFAGARFPVAERLARQVVSLPMHAYLQPSDEERIVAAVHEALAASPGAGGHEQGRAP